MSQRKHPHLSRCLSLLLMACSMQKANTPPDFESIGERGREKGQGGLKYFALFFFFVLLTRANHLFQNFK